MAVGQSVQPRMTIYLDTILWNELCDQRADAGALTSALVAQRKALALGAEAIYECLRRVELAQDRLFAL